MVLVMSVGTGLRKVSVIFPAAAMIASVNVTDLFLVYLCLKNTMSDTLPALVFVTHRS